MVPIQAYELNVKKFYTQKENYMKIYVKDPFEKAKYMQVIIWRSFPKERLVIRLSEYEK